MDLLIDPQYKNLPNFVALLRTFEVWCRKGGMIDSIAVEFAGLPHIHENLLFLGYSERANGHDIWIDKAATIDINSSFWTSAEGDFI